LLDHNSARGIIPLAIPHLRDRSMVLHHQASPLLYLSVHLEPISLNRTSSPYLAF
jgi:hypothetical protein